MSKKKFLHLLILCGILSQGIIATSGEDTRESSDFLERKKRVINHLPGGQNRTQITQANYIVNLKRLRRSICIGAILSHYSVITAASCFIEHESLTEYTILSGGAYDVVSNTHEVTSKAVYYGNPPHQFIDGIALITVDPPFLYNRTTGYIPLHEGTLRAGTIVTVRGWGHYYALGTRLGGIQRRLRTINLPIMNHGECVNDYRHNRFRITEKHICTYDQQQYCASTDVGAPLVFNDSLVGIHVWKENIENGRNPDVYVDVNRAEYKAWIRENTLLM